MNYYRDEKRRLERYEVKLQHTRPRIRWGNVAKGVGLAVLSGAVLGLAVQRWTEWIPIIIGIWLWNKSDDYL